MKVGDHEFTGGLCLKCGRRWVDVRLVDHTYVNLQGFACRGALTDAEITEYISEREREDAAIADAMTQVGRA